MAAIEVDVLGLSVLAGHHEQQAALLAAIAAPVETPAMRGGMPGGIVGGVLPDNVLPYFIEPPGTKDLPVIGDGKPDGPQA